MQSNATNNNKAHERPAWSKHKPPTTAAVAVVAMAGMGGMAGMAGMAAGGKKKLLPPFSPSPAVHPTPGTYCTLTAAHVPHDPAELVSRNHLRYASKRPVRTCAKSTVAVVHINSRVNIAYASEAPFSCTPRVQEAHTQAEVVHITPRLLGLRVFFNCHA